MISRILTAVALVFLVFAAPLHSAFTLQTNDGQHHVGSLEQLDSQQVVVRTEDGSQTVGVDQILRVVNDGTTTIDTEPAVTIELTDSTRLGATDFELSDKASIRLVGGVVLQTDSRSLRTVRFQKPGLLGPLDNQWTEFVSGDHEGDLLIVRKNGPDGPSLSYLEGTIRSVTGEHVDFVFDGDELQVKREKIEGLCFLSRAHKNVRADRVVRALGSCSLQAKSIRLAGDDIAVELVCGDQVQIPLSIVQSIDFAATRIVYLSALEPHKLTVTPRLPTATLSGLSNRLIYAPGIDKSLSGRRLSLPSADGGILKQYFEYGLSLHSRTELIYRLNELDLGRLKGAAGLDPDLKQRGFIHLLIEGDDQPLLEHDMGPNDPPLPIDVSVAGVRRLRILVDYGDQLDAADHLNLCEIRLTP